MYIFYLSAATFVVIAQVPELLECCELWVSTSEAEDDGDSLCAIRIEFDVDWSLHTVVVSEEADIESSGLGDFVLKPCPLAFHVPCSQR